VAFENTISHGEYCPDYSLTPIDPYYNYTTDAEGRFVFDKVPPGEHLLYGEAPVTSTHPMPVSVKAGDIIRVNYGGTGRRVIGRVAGEVDWSRKTQLLAGKLAPAGFTPAPRSGDFVTKAAFEKAMKAYNDRVNSQMLPGRPWYDQVIFDTDGSFRIEDVPAGTYELRLQVTVTLNNSNPSNRGKELAWLEREVVVSAMPGDRSDTPLDLGQLTLNWADPTHPGQQTK